MNPRFRTFPTPYFGSKRHAAQHVWQALGDVEVYVEPFCGSCAVLLLRPHEPNRPFRVEIVNDKDGLLVNALRSLQMRPDETAEAASWYYTEVDLTARHYALVQWAQTKDVERLLADPRYCDPVIGGWWLWGLAMWIGSGWCRGDGAWAEDPNRPGRLTKRDKDKDGLGVPKQRPSANLKGLHHGKLRNRGLTDHNGNYHAMVMDQVREWFRYISARLRHVQILQGDWTRCVTDASLTGVKTYTASSCGFFFDPPYGAEANRHGCLYAHDDLEVATEVLDWCVRNSHRKNTRIVLAGFEGDANEQLAAHGWRKLKWYRDRYHTGGYARTGKDKAHQQHREVLWLSPQCLTADWELPLLPSET